jgi:hypothetical protein
MRRSTTQTEGLIAPRAPGSRPVSPTLGVPSLHDLPPRPLSPLGPPSPRTSFEAPRPVSPRMPRRSLTGPPEVSVTAPPEDVLGLDRTGLGFRRVPSYSRS